MVPIRPGVEDMVDPPHAVPQAAAANRPDGVAIECLQEIATRVICNQEVAQMTNTDRIEKLVELRAPVARVWSALTNYQDFGAWFGVKLEAPFAVGKTARGKITHPGYEHLVMELVVRKMEPETIFSFNWHPYGVDSAIDYKKEEPTLVEFTLKAIPLGTLLTVSESGFDKIPAYRRDEAFRMNEGGWAQQMKNIEAYVAKG